MENIKLRSVFNKRCIPITAAVARQSKVIREKLEARALNSNENPVNEEDNIVTIILRGSALDKIIQWCDHHKDDPIHPDKECFTMGPREGMIDDIPPWDKEFFKLYNMKLLSELIHSAKQLKIHKMWYYALKTFVTIATNTRVEKLLQLMTLDYDDEEGSVKAA